MAKQWVMEFLPDGDGNKLVCSYVATGLETTANQISLYLGDDVPLYRQSEYKNAWKWLYEGIKSRNLLESPSFVGQVLYTGADINALTIANRRTSVELTFYAATDVVLSIGSAVTTKGDTNYLEAAFQQLIEFAAEESLKVA